MRAFICIVAAGFLALGAACSKESKKSEDSRSEALADEQAGATRVAAAPAAELTAEPAADEDEGSCGGDGSCCGGHPQVAATDDSAVPDDAVWTTMKVTGMKCVNCAKRIQASLADMDGILGVAADHTTGEVRIASAPGTDDVSGKVRPHLDALGYRVSDI